jgi:hypothetical protein
MEIGIILTWVSRYWALGLLTLGIMDWVNGKNAADGVNERFTNKERLMVFGLWPMVILIFVFYLFYNKKQ